MKWNGMPIVAEIKKVVNAVRKFFGESNLWTWSERLQVLGGQLSRS